MNEGARSIQSANDDLAGVGELGRTLRFDLAARRLGLKPCLNVGALQEVDELSQVFRRWCSNGCRLRGRVEGRLSHC
ncbi:hypothetical protein [Sinorhizobium mexicanum]|uniref:hypothetical protein n=1 Tax=Sinorhizobium mexicanum TaxID=375549 RepID=UPI001AE42073|nr:hypothetical protein [Sinorhizobium mexicanum]MBP1884425.1 hypothetical protein [Sinorhizobium mexicanum]